MSKVTVIIGAQRDRDKLRRWVDTAPWNTVVSFSAPKRTVPQSDKMWACLTDIAAQKEWHGQRLTAADWKLIFLDALDREVRAVPSLDGSGFVSLGRSSSSLTKDQMSDLIELILAWGSQNEVVFNDGHHDETGKD